MPTSMPGADEIETRRAWREMGLDDREYGMIKEILGRPPSWAELGMFSAMWSEHCAYKHSKNILKTFPTSGPGILVGPGENAGAYRLDDRWAIVWKKESHNHPSAVEPFNGAATGVGGVVRDILAMGARPIALLSSLRFGPLDDPRQRRLLSGVVEGAVSYANCIGVPMVGGELGADECYSANPLVNVTCVGLVEADKIAKARASGVGNPVFLVGSPTGRDGVQGCTFASEELDESSQERAAAVPLGDPEAEKLLIEACLELLRSGCVSGIQDMGAAGITSSCAETAWRAGTGMELHLDEVPLREEGMTAYEILLSESQERMLVVAERERADDVVRICGKWGVPATKIGTVTGDGFLRVFHEGAVVAEVPAKALTQDAPVYDPPERKPDRPAAEASFDPGSLPELSSREDLEAALEAILASEDVCSKEPIYSTSEPAVQGRVVIPPGSDAAALRIEDSGGKGIAISADGNERHCHLDPYWGGAATVAEAARNLACVGARPVGITNCLNFGSPEKPEVMWQFKHVVEGMAAACRALGTPVTGGNVSFYNEAPGKAIYPTPIVGALGVIDSIERTCTAPFKAGNDAIAVLGPIGGSIRGLAGSQYSKTVHGVVAGTPPEVDLELEARVQEACLEAISGGLVASAHDCSAGGLAVALAECCFPEGRLGAEVELEAGSRPDALLFSEEPSRIVLSIPRDNVGRVEAVARKWEVPFAVIGEVSANARLAVKDSGKKLLDVPVERLLEAWRRTLSWLAAR